MDQSLYDALYTFTETHPSPFEVKDVLDDTIYIEPYLYEQPKTPVNNFAVNYSFQTPQRPNGPTPLQLASPRSSPVPSLSSTPTSSPASSRPPSAEDIPVISGYGSPISPISPISPPMQPVYQPSFFGSMQDQYLAVDQQSRLPRKTSMPSLQAQRMPLPQQNTVRRASSAFNLNQQNRSPRRPSQLSFVSNAPHQQYLQPQSAHVARQHTQPIPMSNNYLTPVLQSRSQSYMSTAPSSPLSHLNISGVSLGLEDLDLLDELSPTEQAPPRASPIPMPMSAPAWQTSFDIPKASTSYAHQSLQPAFNYSEPRYGWQPQMAPQSYYLGQENYSLQSAPALQEDGVPDYFSLQHARRRGSSVDSGVSQALPETPSVPLASPSTRKIKKRPTPKSSRRGSAPAGAQFVNFTSADSMKLLSGVAPSGSSKRKRDDVSVVEKDGKRRVSSNSQ